ncbi:MAG: response regulator transcription factor [Kiritimatiellae bacterium]|nr:response regulator transcription factor [Kiritimatiellia bacterium]
MSKISILIADDHKIVRMGLKSLFAAEKDLVVVGEADDGDLTVRQALQLSPDIIIMDLMMPKMDGVAATAEIHAKLPKTRIVVLTSYSTSDTIAAALAAGAAGAIMKSADDSTLLTAVRSVAAGKKFISPEVKGLLAFDPPAPTLSPRQQEVLVSLAKGFNNNEIANQLGISKTVAKEHVETLLVKLDAANRTEAVAIALRKQLVKI